MRRMLQSIVCTLVLVALVLAGPVQAQNSKVVQQTSPKVVKIYGAGGFRGLEAYQSGILISAEGHILTVWSYVLDTNYLTVVLDDGQRFEEAKLLGADPRLELAVLKIDAELLPHFDLNEETKAGAGSRVLAFSNLYGVAQGDEAVSAQHGVVSVRTRLEARRGVFETPFQGEVYVVDAITNNAGAQGGALTDRRGRLLGMLGKELRNKLNNTWLNYAIPVDQMRKSVEDIKQGLTPAVLPEEGRERPALAHSLGGLGLALVPDVLERTPPFVDQVRAKSPAAMAGLKADDLVLFVNGRLVQSCKALVDELEHIDQADKVELTVIRDQALIEVELKAE